MLRKHSKILSKNNAILGRHSEELVDHKSDIAWIKANMATKQDFAKISETLDRILAMVTGNAQEMTMTKREMGRHDARITKLEQTVGVA